MSLGEGRRGSHSCRRLLDGKRTERPLLSRANTGLSLAKDLGVLVLAFSHLKSAATSWSEKVFEGRPSHTSNRPSSPGQGEGGVYSFA